ncbi:hypothetical protein B0H14DRAFT_3867018 [Mycena olivaceomarginata]|nr:hypothetical protein B0H14DRAFT_3867018 [Mycena olivaceomarginata]
MYYRSTLHSYYHHPTRMSSPFQFLTLLKPYLANSLSCRAASQVVVSLPVRLLWLLVIAYVLLFEDSSTVTSVVQLAAPTRPAAVAVVGPVPAPSSKQPHGVTHFRFLLLFPSSTRKFSAVAIEEWREEICVIGKNRTRRVITTASHIPRYEPTWQRIVSRPTDISRRDSICFHGPSLSTHRGLQFTES